MSETTKDRSSEDVLAELKDFQRETVGYVFDHLYGPEATGRFLVADEVGLGKTLVARGVIARAIEHLKVKGIPRIDVIYICSNERFDPARAEVEAVERLLLHPWPSNVREIAAVVDRIAMMEPPPALRLQSVEAVLGKASAPAGTLTRETVDRALAEADGNESEAARRLGVSRGKLLRFLESGKTA